MKRISYGTVLPLLVTAQQVLAGSPNSAYTVQSVPAVTQPGLLILAIAVGILGARLIGRFRK
jgi:hypothetical protein